MMMNITKSMMFMIMIISVIMTLSSNNLMYSWISLEINFISFIPLMTNKKMISDQLMKYFIIQSSSSFMLLMSILMNSIIESPINTSILLLISLLMKMGMMPMHLWMPNLMQKISWMNCLLLMTLQKIIPVNLTFQLMNIEMMFLPMMLSLILSPLTGMKQLSMKKMMSYSSISNLPWMLMSIFNSKLIFMFFMIIYFMMNKMIINILMTNKMNYMNQMKTMNKEQKLNLIIMMLSMSGMPPMMGFLPKWLILEMMLKHSLMMSTLMIISSTISLFMYMKMISLSMMMMSLKKKKKMNKPSLNIIMINFISMMIILTIMNL